MLGRPTWGPSYSYKIPHTVYKVASMSSRGQVATGNGAVTNHHSEPPSQASTDQFAAIADFLDELEAKTPINHLQKETDASKTLLDTINALIAVVGVVI
jgi:hypothetical protein